MPKKPDRTVRCVYCGREFIEPIPHKCNKNYRKKHLKWINLMEDKRKPFNAEEFISNEKTPVETRDGIKVEILSTTRKSNRFAVVGDLLMENGTTDSDPKTWTQKGKYNYNGDDSYRDLFFSVKKKTRRMTNRELAFWLIEHPEEHREICYKAGDSIYHTYSYWKDREFHECPDSILIRYNGGEWKEPLIEE